MTEQSVRDAETQSSVNTPWLAPYIIRLSKFYITGGQHLSVFELTFDKKLKNKRKMNLDENSSKNTGNMENRMKTKEMRYLWEVRINLNKN